MTSFPLKRVTRNPPPKGIFCSPKSLATPNGFGNDSGMFAILDYTAVLPSGTYERDVNGDYVLNQGVLATSGDSVYTDATSKLYARREVPEGFGALQAGNCAWTRASDGLVLSWDGPWGFQIAPPTNSTNLLTQTPPVYAGGYSPRNKNVTVFFSNVSSPHTRTTRLTIYQRWGSILYCNGVAIPTPDRVLGACMVNDLLVVVVTENDLEDRVYYGKYSELGTVGWTLAGSLNFTNTATRTFLARDHVYTFSEDGLSFNAILRIADEVALNTAKATTATPKVEASKLLIRGTISELNGVVTLNSHTEELFIDIDIVTTSVTYNNVHTAPSADVGDEGRAFASANVQVLFAAGFLGNTEKLIQPVYTGTNTADSTWDVNLTSPTIGTKTGTGSTSLSYAITIGASTFTSTITGSSSSNRSRLTQLDGVEATSSDTETTTLYRPMYCDIAVSDMALLKTIVTNSSSSTTTAGVSTGTQSRDEDLEFETTRSAPVSVYSETQTTPTGGSDDVLGGAGTDPGVTSSTSFSAGFYSIGQENFDFAQGLIVTGVIDRSNASMFQLVGRLWKNISQAYEISVVPLAFTPLNSVINIATLTDIAGDVSLIGVFDLTTSSFFPKLFKI